MAKLGTMQVRLSEEDLLLAEWVAKMRNRRTATSDVRPDADLVGAKGELAFRLAFLDWFELPEPKTRYEEDGGWDFDMPDGRRVDVKTITDPGLNLLVPKHARAGTYVLVLAEDDLCTLLGWISGGSASTEGTVAKWGTHYVVAQDKLRTFTSLHTSYDPDHPRNGQVHAPS